MLRSILSSKFGSYSGSQVHLLLMELLLESVTVWLRLIDYKLFEDSYSNVLILIAKFNLLLNWCYRYYMISCITHIHNWTKKSQEYKFDRHHYHHRSNNFLQHNYCFLYSFHLTKLEGLDMMYSFYEIFSKSSIMGDIHSIFHFLTHLVMHNTGIPDSSSHHIHNSNSLERQVYKYTAGPFHN